MEQSNIDTVEALVNAMMGHFEMLKKVVKSNPVGSTISMTLPDIVTKLPKDIESYSWLGNKFGGI
jgi:hexokinase